MEGDTASLRKAAPNWTLAGDKQLLGMLQQIHQSIMTKCQEANLKLEAMVDALDTASIDLQNVNNKFMALSNNQFIESRVYDDDVDIKGEETTKKQEIPQVVPESDLQKVKRCLQQLEMMHETVLIVDSDSSDDEESSMVLKPKDIYAHRPLPHIIGSQAWKNKWHAGLLPEDSDGDSSISKRESEQYSDSEPEVAVEVTDKHTQRTISSSSSMESEVLSRSSQPVASPAEVAAELARRLAGPPKVPAEPQTMLPPEPIKKVYGVDKPLPATIFPTEPLPLDADDSDKYSDDDIFAELHKKPHQNSYRDSQKSNFTNNIVDELFGDSKDIGNIVPDYDQGSDTRDNPPLFDDVSSSNKQTNGKAPSTDVNIKKPIGGISLFGSNKGAENIGAAILKRHQRKSSTEDDASDEQTKPVKRPETDKKEKKIIEDLFTKPTVKKKDTSKKIDNVKPVDKVDNKPKDSKVDLFSDNIFDDIDDIFTTNIAKPKNDKNTKSIFDDDDLFADIVDTVTPKVNVEIDKPKDKHDEKSIFDSDDDLFSDNVKDSAANDNKTISKPNAGTVKTLEAIKTNTLTSKDVSKETENKKVTSIFDDDSDDDLFSDIRINKTEVVKEKDEVSVVTKAEANVPSDNLFSKVNKNLTNKLNTVSKQLQSPNLFDDNDDEDLFGVNTEQNVKSILKTPLSTESQKSHEPVENDKINNIVDTNVEKNKNRSSNSLNEISNSEDNLTTEENITISDVKQTTQVMPSSSKNGSLDVNITNKSVKEDEIMTEENKEELHKTETISSGENLDDNTIKKNVKQDKTITEENKEDLNKTETISSNGNVDDNTIKKNVKQDKTITEENKEDLNKTETISSNGNVDDNTIKKNVKQDKIMSEENKEELHKTETISSGGNLDDNTVKKNATQHEIISEKNKGESHEKEINTSENKDARVEPNTDTLFSEPLPELKEPDIFSDVFNDLPPAFEKPNESKKNKNVNALFDDDSDDEALFFKKNDVISDEKPDLDYSSDRFRIFHDEPPDIDVDFAQKPLKTTNISNEKDNDDLFSEIPPVINETNEKIDVKDSSILVNKPVEAIDITKLLEETSVKEEVNITQLLEDEQDTQSEDDSKTESKVEQIIQNIEENKSEENRDIQISEDESSKKSIGKLKPMSFNINVNTLLPGASPKKSKANEETDGQTISTHSDAAKDGPNTDTKMVKSVSFEGDPDSEVLDNKLSKGRAKIQVKRRPSTRRARLEAVRKSGIDFGSDSTDNSGSFDEHKSKTTEYITDSPVERYIKDNKNIDSENVIDNANVNKTTSVSKAEPKQKPEVKSKVVYILNDEDIFSNTAETITKNDKPRNTSSAEVLQQTNHKKDSSKDKDIKVNTKDRKPLFDDLSDEELFSKKPVHKAKESLFDSDSDEELFSKKEKKIEQKKEKARVSLFDDESDDDLFLSKTAKVSETNPTTRRNQPTKATEPVFEDPLSMLGDDES